MEKSIMKVGNKRKTPSKTEVCITACLPSISLENPHPSRLEQLLSLLSLFSLTLACVLASVLLLIGNGLGKHWLSGTKPRPLSPFVKETWQWRAGKWKLLSDIPNLHQVWAEIPAIKGSVSYYSSLESFVPLIL